MKKSILALVFGIAFLVVGCGKEDVNVPYESQIEESSNIEMNTEIDDGEKLDDYMASIKEQSDIIMTSLEQDELTQTEMNIKSQELYMLWDEALNYLWDELKHTLAEEEFSKLLDEQRTWIVEKEKDVEEAGKEVAGGSLYSLVINMKAAEITEQRVYELYELLK